ncbi:MAG: carbamoyltransferase [Bryobacterales bacterium]|nr:carbamoyltransferase [Bryobacterales bacterium]
MIILGVGGMLGDAASAIVRDGQLAGAVEELKLIGRAARWGRREELPEHAIAACLSMAGVRAGEVDSIAIVRPIPSGPGTPFYPQLRARFPNSRVVLVEHHMAHAAAAFYASPFDDATVLTLDRTGDFRCGARWNASGHTLALEKESFYPDSLGDLYGRVTRLLGFRSNAEEHKVQWLSAAGDNRFQDVFEEIMGRAGDGWPRMDRAFFDAERMAAGGFGAKFFQRLGVPDGGPVPEPLRPQVAAGIQRALESKVIEMAGSGHNLCLGGGLGLNALLVAALERSGRFGEVFVQPAAGNAGNALGAALYAWHQVYGRRERIGMGNLCLGPGFSAEQIKQVLENCKLRFRYLLTTDELIETAVAQLNDSKIVGWMQGRMEFGPRALGNRSILASPLDAYSTENLNAYIKHRESFRKFAASVPAEVASEYFEVGPNARFLATVGRVRPKHRKTFEGAILSQDMVRVHTVVEQDNPLYWRLLQAAGKATGLPVLYNTSFNLFGDPLICTPRDAVRSFYSSGIDALFAGNFFLEK